MIWVFFGVGFYLGGAAMTYWLARRFWLREFGPALAFDDYAAAVVFPIFPALVWPVVLAISAAWRVEKRGAS